MTPEFLTAKKWAILQQPGQSSDLSPIKHAFQILKTKLKAENRKQAAVKASAVKASQKS